MYHYIILWIITIHESTACPFTPPQPDKFGRVSNTHMVPAVACFTTFDQPYKKEFNSRDSAYMFYNELIAEQNKNMIETYDSTGKTHKEYFCFGESCINDAKIDSVKIK